MTNVLRMERYNFFANAPYGSVEKLMLENVGHVTCISCFLRQELFSPTRIFKCLLYILGEEIEHAPQQL